MLLTFLLLTIPNMYRCVSISVCGGIAGHYMHCGDGTCVSIAKACNGVKDCRNGRDERECGSRYVCRQRLYELAQYPCRKACHNDADCRGNKRCVCDDECGRSCINPNSPCLNEPPTVQHARVLVKRVFGKKLRPILTNYRYADVATYDCERGYRLVGPTPRCNGKRRWSKESPVCKDITCRDHVPIIPHARDYRIFKPRYGKSYHHNYSNATVGDRIIFTCEDGHDLIGLPPVCGPDLRYGTFTARCVLTCHHQRDNGLIDKYGLDCGRACRGSSDCRRGEQCVCVGPCSRVCVNQGADCPDLPARAHAQVTYEGSGVGKTARYRCEKGYYMQSGRSSIHCSSSGTWLEVDELPTCTLVRCGSPYRSIEGSNGYVLHKIDSSLGRLAINTTVSFGCNENRQLMGSQTRHCLENGLWSGRLAVCFEPDDRTRCRHPGVPINGRLFGSDFNIGATVRFRCNDDYIMYGSSVQNCSEDRQWSGDGAPICKHYRHPFEDVQSIEIFQIAVSQMPERKEALSRTIDVNDGYDTHEVFFVIDVSKSVDAYDLKDEIGFAIALVQRLKEFRKSVRYAIMIFATKPKILLQFTDNNNIQADHVIDNLRYVLGNITTHRKEIGTWTATLLALKTMQREIALSRQIHGSDGVKTHVFVFTDGQHTLGLTPKYEREDIENEFDKTVEFYSITACDDCDKDALEELKALASYQANFIRISDYYQLEKYLKKVTNIVVDYSKCGKGGNVGEDVRKSSLGRIYGGRKSNITAWPWQAAIVDRAQPSELELRYGLVIGGGSIINKKWILTAAHVIGNSNITRFVVVLGLFQHSKTDKPTDITLLPLQRFMIEKHVPHPEFNKATYNNDIALIKLGALIDNNFKVVRTRKKGIKFSFFVRPICLPCTGTCFTETIMETLPRDNAALARCPTEANLLRQAEQNAVVTGYGHTRYRRGNNYDGTVEVENAKLRQVLLKIANNTICAEQVHKVGSKYLYNENTICTSPTMGEKSVDACKGDSGGPMIREIYDRNSSKSCWVQIGLVSFGKGCGAGHVNESHAVPGYYTNLMSYILWINETIGDTLPGPS